MASEMAKGTTADIPERTADVIVVGAGIIGCATAYYLAKKGTSVIVLEAVSYTHLTLPTICSV